MGYYLDVVIRLELVGCCILGRANREHWPFMHLQGVGEDIAYGCFTCFLG
jgi:hypothetical protein